MRNIHEQRGRSSYAPAREWSGRDLIMKTSRARRLFSHLARVVMRALVATLILWLAVVIPLPRLTPQFLVMARVPVVIFLFIAYMGKLLYDTFFYDRYG